MTPMVLNPSLRHDVTTEAVFIFRSVTVSGGPPAKAHLEGLDMYVKRRGAEPPHEICGCWRVRRERFMDDFIGTKINDVSPRSALKKLGPLRYRQALVQYVCRGIVTRAHEDSSILFVTWCSSGE